MPLPQFNHFAEFEREFLNPAVERLAMTVEHATLEACATDWTIEPNGLICKKDFYDVIAVKARQPHDERMLPYLQIRQRGGEGHIALICNDILHRGPHLRWFLVTAKAEPGNKGIPRADGSNSRVLLAPPIQYSPHNLRTNPGVLPFTDLLPQIEWSPAPEDGGRFYQKVNKYGYHMLRPAQREPVNAEVERHGNMAWVQVPLLRELIKRGYVNGHFRSALATFF